MKVLHALIFLTAALSGCATVTQGTKDVLVIETTPEEAQV